MDRNAWKLNWRSALSGKGDRELLDKCWAELWSDEVSLLIRERTGRTASVRPLDCMIGGSCGLALEAHAGSLQRQARRLYRTLELEPMMEERTFGDYRVSLEQRIDALRSEAASAREGADIALKAIADLTGSFSDSSDFIELKRVLEISRRQCREIETSIGEPQFKGLLADAFRERWFSVTEQFGTWQRRIQPALVNFAAFGALSVIGYMALVLWLPAPLLLGVAAIFPIGAAVSRYYVTRHNLSSAIASDRAEISALDPDEDPHSATWLWSPAGDRLDGAGNEIEEGLSRIRQRGKKSVRYKGGAVWAAVVIVAFTVATPWFFAVVYAPDHGVWSNSTSGSACVLETGRVLWPGPGGVLVMGAEESRTAGFPRGLGVVSVLRSESVGQIKRLGDDQTLPRCVSGTPDVPLSLNLTIPSTNSSVELRRLVVLPIFTGPVTCDEVQMDSKRLRSTSTAVGGSKANASSETIIANLSRGIAACGADRPVVVDVRGFASSSEFNCREDFKRSSDGLNVDLAEIRRRDVIDRLRNGVPRGDGYGPLIVVLEDQPRWGAKPDSEAYDRMTASRAFEDRDGQLVDTAREALSRYVEIEILSPGGCRIVSPASRAL